MVARNITNQNNEMLTSSFITNIPDKSLSSLRTIHQEILLKQTIQNHDLNSVKKIIPILISSLPNLQTKPAITTRSEQRGQ